MNFIQKTSIYKDNIIEFVQCRRDVKNDFYPMLSNAYFCNECGRIWAKIARITAYKLLRWEVIHTECLDCAAKDKVNARLNVPGSLWNPFLDNKQLDYLSMKALRRELNILLDLEDRK